MTILTKNTKFDDINIGDEIPSFEIEELDLGLASRNFKTGTVIKLYSYQL